MPSDVNVRDQLVAIDEQGVARPLGELSREAMMWLQDATMRVVTAPDDVLVLQRIDPHTAADEGFFVTGEIGVASKLHDVCGMLVQSRWRGELTVGSHDATRTILINDGNVMGAWSTNSSERLGSMLVHFGAMTPEQVDATARSVGRGVRFGDAAVGLGFLTRETLFRSLQRQTELIVYAALATDSGTFSFREGFDERSITFPLSVPFHALMLEAVRRMDEWQVYRAQIPSDDLVPQRIAGNRMTNEHPAYDVYLAVDGSRSVADIAVLLGEDSFVVVRQLYELMRSRAVEMGEPGPPEPESGIAAVVHIFNQAIALILSEVDHYPGASQDIRDSLASFASSGMGYAPLFRGAGPGEDGTVDVKQLIANIEQMADANRERAATELLYEYASFAMFISEPVLRAGARSDAVAISRTVAEMLAPIAPDL